MIRMTDRAQERVDAYVGRVRRALAAHPDVDAEEVAGDVRAHVEEALREVPDPVGEDDVIVVLDRLGSPGRWAPTGEVGGWRRVVGRVRSGPDDWRLAYLCIALTGVAILTVPFGVGVLLLLPAFVLARGVVALSEERGEPLGAQRWLVLPALIVVYAGVGVTVLGLPVLVSPIVFSTGGAIEFLSRRYDTGYPAPGTPEHFVRSLGWVVTALGAWWAALGGLAVARPGAVRAALRPLADRFRPAHARIPMLLGVALALLGTVLLVLA